MGIGSLCIIKAYFDVFKVFGYSKVNKRPSQGDCLLIGNYLFVFAYYFSFKSPNTAKKKEPQVKKLKFFLKKESGVTIFTRYTSF
jgi:hypothetical protein